MRNFLWLAVLSGLSFSQAEAKDYAIYGIDNRLEVYEASPRHQLLAKSTAVMISKYDIIRSSRHPGVAQLNQVTLTDWIKSMVESEEASKLYTPITTALSDPGGITFCPGTRFADQPNPGTCSGFLIAPDLIATAGHCLTEESSCTDYEWVFDFEVDKEEQTAGVNVPEQNIYKCEKIVSQALTGMQGHDYGILKLSRPVKGRQPLKIRTESEISIGEPLVVIGSPSGLPTKVAPGAKVRENSDPIFFVANLDTFQGNSGSAVFNDKTGVVEGILVRGDEDYVPNLEKLCIDTFVCKDDECRGEDVSRTTSIPEVEHYSAFMEAAVTEDLFTLDRLITNSYWVDFSLADGQSALIKASTVGKTEAIKFLLSKGASPKKKDAKGNTALHELARTLNSVNSPAVQALLAAGADLESRNNAGETPIFSAVRAKNLEAFRALRKAGANINAVNNEGLDVFQVGNN